MPDDGRNCGCGCGCNNNGFLGNLFGGNGCNSEILFFIINIIVINI